MKNCPRMRRSRSVGAALPLTRLPGRLDQSPIAMTTFGPHLRSRLNTWWTDGQMDGRKDERCRHGRATECTHQPRLRTTDPRPGPELVHRPAPLRIEAVQALIVLSRLGHIGLIRRQRGGPMIESSECFLGPMNGLRLRVVLPKTAARSARFAVSLFARVSQTLREAFLGRSLACLFLCELPELGLATELLRPLVGLLLGRRKPHGHLGRQQPVAVARRDR
jgi:hypothetical protein